MAEHAFFIDDTYFLPVGDAQFSSGNRYLREGKPADQINNNFPVDELLDFSKDDDVIMTDSFFHSLTGDSSTVTAVDSCNSSVSGGCNFNCNLSCRSFTDAPFPASDICVPYDDLAELEWLSNFVEDSFSSDELQNFHLISATKSSAAAASNITDNHFSGTNIMEENSPPAAFPSVVSVPGKARSKRSRAAPCTWTSRLLHLSPASSSSGTNCSIDTATAAIPGAIKTATFRKREIAETPGGRKCLHCGSEKTPQWRTGPLGPKTLCNACGVRYKSGRLVPEYRPAASPTFLSTKHSNSHRKVLELRKQKELRRPHQPLTSHSSIFGASNGGDDDLLITSHDRVCTFV